MIIFVSYAKTQQKLRVLRSFFVGSFVWLFVFTFFIFDMHNCKLTDPFSFSNVCETIAVMQIFSRKFETDRFDVVWAMERTFQCFIRSNKSVVGIILPTPFICKIWFYSRIQFNSSRICFSSSSFTITFYLLNVYFYQKN